MACHHGWLHPDLEVRETPLTGRGIFAAKPLAKGTRLAIFGGKILPVEAIHHAPDHLKHYPLQIEERFVLCAFHVDEPDDTDFFNHSCAPNAGIRGQLFLEAMQDIPAGEEVCFDYAMTVSESPGADVVFEMPCNCGAAACRTIVTESDWKRPDLQKKYDGYFSEYLQRKIRTSGKPAAPAHVRQPSGHRQQ